MTADSKTDHAYDKSCRFIIKLGIAAHGYGPSTARLEFYLNRVVESLGFCGVFRSTPSNITFAFSKKGQVWQRTHIARVSVGGYNMAKLSYVGDLVDKLTSGELSLSEASDRLDEINDMPDPWGVLSYALSFILVGIGFAGLMQGNLWDIGISGLLSLAVYLIVVLAGRVGGRFADGLPFISAYFAGACAAAIKLILPELNQILVTLSAIIVLIPGFAVSAGIIEVIDNRVEAGMARLMSGLVDLIKQFTGAWLGLATVGVFSATQPELTGSAQSSMEEHAIWIYLALLFVGLGVAYQTLMRDFGWVLFSCSLSFGGVIVGSAVLGAELSTISGAIIAGLFANLWARLTGRPTSIVLIPAITVLVSGSIGFRGLVEVAAGQTDKGMDLFFQMFIVAISIGAGLLVANTILRPKITL